MIQTLSIRSIIYLLALIIGVLLLIFRRPKVTGYGSLIAYAICMSLVAILLYANSQTSTPQVTWILKVITDFLVCYLPAFIFTSILGYVSPNQRLSYRLFVVLAIVPAILLVLIVVRFIPGFLLSAVRSLEPQMISPQDIWGWLILVYSIGILVASLILTFSTSRNNLKPHSFTPLLTLGAAILGAILIDGISFTTLVPMVNEYDLMLSGYILVGATFLFINRKTIQTNLITREELFDSIFDGIIILNDEDKILDMNNAAELLIGIPIRQAYGTSVEGILKNWNSMSGSGDVKEKEFRGSIKLNEDWHYINVRVNQLSDERGKVIILRDITDRKDTNETRQNAREEMFIFLRSLYELANVSLSSADFYRDVLFQIAYTFRSESGAICLVDSKPDSTEIKLSLMAKHGTLVKDADTIAKLHGLFDGPKRILGGKEPFIISDVSQDPLYKDVLHQFGVHSIVAFPLLYIEQLMGVLMLARTDASDFTSDEVVRLSIVAEELASFIFNEQRKKSDIALAERRHLGQDLHDSITQKLYGLVALTEAVMMGLESGTPINENRMVEKISEDARQALREMRLFLFELEPVNIRKDGLISTLHQRLASVEGRSNIQARMIADSEISLPTEKEIEIYYIVEEALNNILKHSTANSVLIKMKPRKTSIYLEIVDNGRGFEPEQVQSGGRGLRNMKERALRINGKLKITSSPDHGTKITLVVPAIIRKRKET